MMNSGAQDFVERKTSIETEPRTLFCDEIQFAREGAQFVVNTSTTEEANAIFTKGLEPVVCGNLSEKRARMGLSDEECDYASVPPLPNDNIIRSVVTAPF